MSNITTLQILVLFNEILCCIVMIMIIITIIIAFRKEFTVIFLKQTMFLGYTVLQLFYSYNLWFM
jgi:hypothetical protein